jgi:hypothetical protein
MTEQTKTCRICYTEKPLSAFTGRRCECKPCRADAARQRYMDDPGVREYHGRKASEQARRCKG